MTAFVVLPLTVVLAYLVGAIPFGYLVARSKGVNIFEEGSGNIGATNVGRVLGKKFGILVFVLDFLKGAIPTLSASLLTSPTYELPNHTLAVSAGVMAFLGHLFPIYLGFRGGKGVATGTGVVAVLLPLPTLAALFTWVLLVACTGYVSVASLLATTLICLLQFMGTRFALTPQHLLLNGFCLLITILVYVRHGGNLRRLFAGTENRLKETVIMHLITKLAHVLVMGFWFGMSVFFSVVVALSMLAVLQGEARKPQEARPDWFPLAKTYNADSFSSQKLAKLKEIGFKDPIQEEIRQIQGTRAFGHVIEPMFDVYFLLQVVCGAIAVITAFSWSWSRFPQAVNKARSWVLLVALITVGVGWWMEVKVSGMRQHRTEVVSKVLAADNEDPSKEEVEAAKAARAEFGKWHGYSLIVNFVTLLLVAVGMTLSASLPTLPKEENVSTPIETE